MKGYNKVLCLSIWRKNEKLPQNRYESEYALGIQANWDFLARDLLLLQRL